MTQHDIQLTGRLTAIEFILTQLLTDKFQRHSPQEIADSSARILASLDASLSSQPDLLRTGTHQKVKEILIQAAARS